jgi:ubiquinone/menaquinone biosynthesis C-methylase UbiE
MTSTIDNERYAGGYGAMTIEGLSHRTLAQDGAFFVRHHTPAMNVLDCGCGPGVLTIDIARIANRGSVVGIDLAADQIELGRTRARDAGCANVRFERADVYSLPFPDDTFDSVFAHALLYHLHRPLDALREIYRVLKPGGVAAIRDADAAGDVYAPQSASLDRTWALVNRVFESNGAHMDFGRTHRGALRRAGFVRTQASASYDSVGTPEATAWFSSFWIYFLTDVNRAPIVARGSASDEEIDEAVAALREWGRHPEAFYARCRCEALGWKDASEAAQ